MDDKEKQNMEGLNQIIKIINAKGDSGEIKEILDSSCDNLEKDKPEPESI